MKLLAIAAAMAAIITLNTAQAEEGAQYQVRFDATWTASNHPLDYPGSAHLSGLIGTTHDANYRLFADGATASSGLEALSERGAHSPLDKEIRSAIANGTAGGLFESDPLFEFPGSISAKFKADKAHPMVSVAAMVAPSPDWFTGVSRVNLRKDGRWVSQVKLKLYAWDAGTDSGTTYAAPDADTMPRQSIRLNASPQFKGAGGLTPVGTITFTRIDKTMSN